MGNTHDGKRFLAVFASTHRILNEGHGRALRRLYHGQLHVKASA